MLLDDTSILAEISRNNLVSNSLASQVESCAYRLRVGAVFEPKTGNYHDTPPAVPGHGTPKCFFLGPGQCIVIKTRETVHMTADLCGYYHPLNSLAWKGVMLLNASIIEPCYSGPLSCFLVNFSHEEVEIHPGMDIAKISFHELVAEPAKKVPYHVSAEKYDRDLSLSARRFNLSFLGIDEIAEKAAEKAQASVNSSIKFGGIMIAILLLFAQIEPLMSKWLWEGSGVATVSTRMDEVKLAKDLEILKLQQQGAADRMTDRAELAKLTEQVKQLQEKVSNPK